MRKVAGFIALGLLGGLIGTQLPGEQVGGCHLKVVGLPAVAREVLETRGATVTQQDAVSLVEGSSKEATFKALSFAHVVLEAQYNAAYHNLQLCDSGEGDFLQVRYDPARGTVENVAVEDVNESQEETVLDQADLGLVVIEKAMQRLDPSLVTP